MFTGSLRDIQNQQQMSSHILEAFLASFSTKAVCSECATLLGKKKLAGNDLHQQQPLLWTEEEGSFPEKREEKALL